MATLPLELIWASVGKEAGLAVSWAPCPVRQDAQVAPIRNEQSPLLAKAPLSPTITRITPCVCD